MIEKKLDVLLETVNFCNLRCPACPWHSTMTREKRILIPEEFERIFSRISLYTKSICFYVMGEPLLNPYLFEYISTAHSAGIRTGFSTNGMLLGEHINDIFISGLNFIQIALDGLDPQTYESYRVGSDFHLIVENLHRLSKEKQKRCSLFPEIQIQTLITRQNEYQLPEFQSFANELGAMFSAKKMMFGKTDETIQKNRAVFEPKQQKYQRLNNPTLQYFRDMPLCPQLESLTILCNADVVPCCYDYDGKMVLGNLTRQTLPEIMEGMARKEFVMKKQLGLSAICNSCDMVANRQFQLPKAILFDFGRTLVIMPDISIRNGVINLLDSLGMIHVENIVERYYLAREKLLEQLCPDKRRRMIYPEVTVMKQLFREFHIKTNKSFTELELIFSDGCSRGKPTEGSVQLLEKLRSLGIASGVVTNNRYSEGTVNRKLKNLFPMHTFDVIVSSSEEKCNKPDRKIFQAALTRLKLAPSEVWFVGDSQEDDVEGSSQIGMIPFTYLKYAKVSTANYIPNCHCCALNEWTDLEMILDSCTDENGKGVNT